MQNFKYFYSPPPQKKKKKKKKIDIWKGHRLEVHCTNIPEKVASSN